MRRIASSSLDSCVWEGLRMSVMLCLSVVQEIWVERGWEVMK
jgi:hypothetical protein